MNDIEQPKIQPVTLGSNRWCGPAALSIITGMDTGRCAKFLRKVSGKRAIRGLRIVHVIKALHELGYRLDPVPVLGKTSLKKLHWRESGLISIGYLHLLVVGNHYALIQRDEYCCGLSKVPVPVSSAPYAKKHVKHNWIVSRTSYVDFSVVCPEETEQDKDWFSKIAVYRRAKEIGAEVYLEDGSLWVYPPSGIMFEDHDPYEGEHLADCWKTAAVMLETYALMQGGSGGHAAREAAERS